VGALRPTFGHRSGLLLLLLLLVHPNLHLHPRGRRERGVLGRASVRERARVRLVHVIQYATKSLSEASMRFRIRLQLDQESPLHAEVCRRSSSRATLNSPPVKVQSMMPP
jgi:hypothetical protein